ncbi:hypothetical protein [Helicovermis profundi]|uniref:HTH cro/C1-type domain-containing protein n=1 Tax=Helicovermis profundi TaxID=3065157 RepID=A0AAU9E968_9FIRM|nr:hypothetical protein HLPR_16180 [Clostridia bacterium S502]
MTLKDTEWISNKLIEGNNLDEILNETDKYFIDKEAKNFLNELLINNKLKKSDVIKLSGLSSAYVYELFNGFKKPTRNKCIQLAYGLKLDFNETQKLLRYFNLNSLYAKVKRDAVVIFCINKKMSLFDTDEILYDLKESTFLSDK